MKAKNKDKWECIGERINLAGVQFSDYQLVCGNLKPGTILQLVGQPKNRYDQFAISVRYKGIHLGYIPRFSIQQSECWNYHKRGLKCIAVLTAFNKSNPTWCMITIQCKHKVGRIKYDKKDEVIL